LVFCADGNAWCQPCAAGSCWHYAYLGAATLVKLGLSTNDVQAVPTGLTRRGLARPDGES
jgi:hypothetical protein